MTLQKSRIRAEDRRICRNLFLIAGNGRKSGKTTLACLLIRQFSSMPVAGIKISSHVHGKTPDSLKLIIRRENYSVYEETDRSSAKDSSRMLAAGASRVFYINQGGEFAGEAFSEAAGMLDQGIPIVCESPSLIRDIEPGVFVIMINEDSSSPRDTEELKAYSHIRMTLDILRRTDPLPFGFDGGRWITG